MGHETTGFTADHLALGLAIGFVAAWASTRVTGDVLMGMATLALLAALTAVSAFTAFTVPGSATSTRVGAGIVAAVITASFLITVDHVWAWMVPTILLVAGMRAPRSRRARLMALGVSALWLLAVWILALV